MPKIDDIPNEEKSSIFLEEYNAGLSLRAIGSKYGCSAEAVRLHLQRHPLYVPRDKGASVRKAYADQYDIPTELNIEAIHRLYNEFGYSVEEIAKNTNRTVEDVQKILDQKTGDPDIG